MSSYDPSIWKGTSNSHRSVARLPEGMTGLEALREHAPAMHLHLMDRVEREAANTFRRMLSQRVEGCHAELTAWEWASFKEAGGETSW